MALKNNPPQSIFNTTAFNFFDTYLHLKCGIEV